ncbi:MAG TPA: hypothetical protein VEZ14_02000 [Dehalococcoidia bacterium]|nr:hypothetical protein [Dehalococcoidia bacterium]
MSRYRRWALLAALGTVAVLAAVLAGTFANRADRARAAGPGTGPDLSITASGLTVTLNASGVGFDPYSGYAFGITFDPNQLVPSNAADHLAVAPFICQNSGPVSMTGTPPAAAGNGAAAAGSLQVACTSASTTTATGALADVTFTAANATPGCTTVSLVAYDSFANNQTTGTYTLDAASNPQLVTYTVSSVTVLLNGQTLPCTPTPTPTATATNTVVAGPSATPTPCSNVGGCPTPAGYLTHTPTPTKTVAATNTPAPPAPTQPAGSPPGGQPGAPGGAPGGAGSGPSGAPGAGSIQPPNTGSGPAGGSFNVPAALLAFIAVLALGGASLGAVGVMARRRSHD